MQNTAIYFFRLDLFFYLFSHPVHREDVLQYMQIYRKRQCMDTGYHELSKRCISSSWKQSSAWECSSCYIIEEKNTYSSWLLGTGMCITLYSTLYAFIMLGWLYSCLQGVYILQTLQGVEKSLMPYSQVFMFFYRFDFPLGELLSHSTLRFSTSWVGARVATFILALHKINTAVAYH